MPPEGGICILAFIPSCPNSSHPLVVEPFQLVDLTALSPVPCPCGQARRAFADFSAFPGTVHLTEISQEAAAHHHNEHTEVYVILECEPDASIELDGTTYSVKPLMAVAIPPGVVHRAIGEMQVLIVCHPEFDTSDEVVQSIR